MKNPTPKLPIIIIIIMIMSALPIEHLSEWRMIVCRKCQHAIWPDQVQSHFQDPQHRVKGKEAAPIAETSQSWPNLIQHPIELNIISQVNPSSTNRSMAQAASKKGKKKPSSKAVEVLSDKENDDSSSMTTRSATRRLQPSTQTEEEV